MLQINSDYYLHSSENKNRREKKWWCSSLPATVSNFTPIFSITSISMWWISMVSKNNKKDQPLFTSLGWWRKVSCYVLMWLPEVLIFLKLIGLFSMIHPSIFGNIFIGLGGPAEAIMPKVKLFFCCWRKKKDIWSIFCNPKSSWTNTNLKTASSSKSKMNSSCWLKKTIICRVKPSLHLSPTCTPTLHTTWNKFSMCILWILKHWLKVLDWLGLHMST